MRAKPNRGPCQVEGCERDAWARGLCDMHYQRWRKHGDPVVVVERWTQTPEERFWSYVEKTEGCWLWTGAKAGGTGYGHIYMEGHQRLAHRFAYEVLIGPIPEGLVLDHLCRVRSCVNPDHLEPVSNAENILRGSGCAARSARVTHCPQGHPYDAENTAIKVDGSRRCKTCHRARERQRRAAS